MRQCEKSSEEGVVLGTVIKDFGKNVGVDNKQVQGLIRLAKQNGEKLGFLS